ncbi:unnamed protein product [Oppiella nova]|uniref:RRM domain-containing protein n=1 Tax=Oppiella nova TaxID=334625 RepID=A0A7R9QCZ2_9ACAR|nr:unnamed protein product [Oppiella nova]CAG2162518.1 unnamed protein product [Oppiella nova]
MVGFGIRLMPSTPQLRYRALIELLYWQWYRSGRGTGRLWNVSGFNFLLEFLVVIYEFSIKTGDQFSLSKTLFHSFSEKYMYAKGWTSSAQGLSDERLYDRDGRTGSLNSYERIVDRGDNPYIKRNIGYLDDPSDYPNRSRSRDRHFSRNINNNNSSYGDPLDSRTPHFRTYPHRNSQPSFDGQRYPSTEQLLDDPNVNSNTSTTTSSLSGQRGGLVGGPAQGSTAASRRMTSVSTTSGGVSSTVSSPPLKKKKKKTKQSLRSHSASPSPSRSSSLSSARSHSPSSSSNISTSSPSSRSPSPAKSQSPFRKERSSSVLISAATTTNNITTTSTQGSNHTPLHNSAGTPGSDSSADKDDSRPLAICVKNLPVRSTDSSLKDGLFHEYKKHGKVTMVKVVGQGTDRFAVVCFKKPEDVDKALVESKEKQFFGCKIEVSAHEGIDAEDNDFRPLEAELDEHHPKATRTLFVGNLERDVSTSDLKAHFEQFGEIIPFICTAIEWLCCVH